MTKEYYGTKRVWAWEAQKDGRSGYCVKYADGYISWSPKNTFEKAYQPLDALSFGHAIEALKSGNLVTRSGWNGKGIYLGLVTESGYGITVPPYRDIHLVHGAYIGIKSVDSKFTPWVASQTDMLANDWQIISEQKSCDSTPTSETSPDATATHSISSFDRCKDSEYGLETDSASTLDSSSAPPKETSQPTTLTDVPPPEDRYEN